MDVVRTCACGYSFGSLIGVYSYMFVANTVDLGSDHRRGLPYVRRTIHESKLPSGRITNRKRSHHLSINEKRVKRYFFSSFVPIATLGFPLRHCHLHHHHQQQQQPDSCRIMAFSSTCVLFLLSMVSMAASSQVLSTEESKPFVYTKVALPMTTTTTTTTTKLDSITSESKQGGSHHYEEPPCTFAEEMAVRIMGIPGQYCAPPCDPDTTACTSDVPDGVTGVRVCVFCVRQGCHALSRIMEGVFSLCPTNFCLFLALVLLLVVARFCC